MKEFLEYILIDNWKYMVIIVPSLIALLEVLLTIIDMKFDTFFIYITKFLKLLMVITFAIYVYLDAFQVEIGTDMGIQLSVRVTSLAIIIAWNTVFERIMNITFEHVKKNT